MWTRPRCGRRSFARRNCSRRRPRLRPTCWRSGFRWSPRRGSTWGKGRRGRGMAWGILVVAGLFEIGWAVGLKYTEGFTRLWPTVLTVASMIASMGLLGLAVRSLPIGTAYAVWTGIGTVGTALLGIVLFREPATVIRLVCIGLIVAGIIGLRLAGGGGAGGP